MRLRFKQSQRPAVDESLLVRMALLALGQIGTNVAAILFAAVVRKWFNELDSLKQSLPFHDGLLDYGGYCLIVPLIWTAWAVRVERDVEASDGKRWMVWGIGWLILALWIGIALNALNVLLRFYFSFD